MTGSCAWDARNNTFGGGETAIVKSGFPTAAENSFGRCGTPYISKDNGATTWDLIVDSFTGTEGQTDLEQKMEGIAYYVKCNILDTETTIKSTTALCPAINVLHANDVDKCDYEASFCGSLNIESASSVSVATSGNINTLKNSGNCFFVADITSASQNDGGKFKVNGQNCNNTTTCKALPKKDGGYYINTTGNLEGGSSWSFSYGTPSCLQ